MPGENIKRGLRVGLRLHEIGDASPYQLFFAAKGKSGASFGFMQGDLAAGQKDVTKTFKKALGAAGIGSAVVDGLVKRLSVHHISSPLSAEETKQVNDALFGGRKLVDDMDERILQSVYDDLDRAIAVAAASGRQVDPKAQIYMALWINMSGPPTKLLDWLEGHNPQLPHPVPKAGEVVDGPAMETYLRATSYYSENPGNFPHLLHCAAAGAAAIGPEVGEPARNEAPAELDARVPAPLAGAADEAVLLGLAEDYDLTEPMKALIKFRNAHGAPKDARYWAIADFDLRSSEPRLFVFDVEARHVQSYLCAHGKGSEGPTDDGYANVFSNVSGSNCTSLGVYRCAETYEGKHGYSMRLDGLEASNSNARARAVVVHGANYVSPEMIKNTGRIGRSDGCLALENRYVSEVVSALTGGSLLIAWSSNGTGRLAQRGDEVEVWSELEPPEAFVAAAPLENTAAALADRIKHSTRIVLARKHSETPQDNATAFQNIADTADGKPAHRSSYKSAPGGTVVLDLDMLKGIVAIAGSYRFSVSEFCGGVHNTNSRHYAGCAADINSINGQPVRAGATATAFQQRCRELGATEVLGPGDKGHATHIHAGWPRP